MTQLPPMINRPLQLALSVHGSKTATTTLLKLISSCRSRSRGRSRLSEPLVRLGQPRTASTRRNSQISRRILWRIGTPADSGVRLLITSIRVEPSVTRIEGGSRPRRGKGRSRHGNRSTGLGILRKKRHGVGGDIGE